MKNEIYVTIILDRSGSMASIKADMEGGLREFIKNSKNNLIPTKFSLVQFDDTYEEVIPLKDINLVNENEIEIKPRGSTALLDAVGKTINSLGENLKSLPESERPNKVVIFTITDGQENCSVEFSREKVKEMTEHQTNVYGWNFTYLGSNQSAFTEAGNIGINANNTLNYCSVGTGAYASTSSMFRSMNMVCSGAMVGSSASFSPSDYFAQSGCNVVQK